MKEDWPITNVGGSGFVGLTVTEAQAFESEGFEPVFKALEPII